MFLWIRYWQNFLLITFPFLQYLKTFICLWGYVFILLKDFYSHENKNKMQIEVMPTRKWRSTLTPDQFLSACSASILGSYSESSVMPLVHIGLLNQTDVTLPLGFLVCSREPLITFLLSSRLLKPLPSNSLYTLLKCSAWSKAKSMQI